MSDIKLKVVPPVSIREDSDVNAVLIFRILAWLTSILKDIESELKDLDDRLTAGGL